MRIEVEFILEKLIKLCNNRIHMTQESHKSIVHLQKYRNIFIIILIIVKKITCHCYYLKKQIYRLINISKQEF